MTLDPNALNAVLTPAVVVEPRRRLPRWLVVATAVVVAGGVVAWGWTARSSLKGLFVEEPPQLPLVEVDQGSLNVFLVETGALESARNTSIKCQVEALLGTTGGAAGTGRTGST